MTVETSKTTTEPASTSPASKHGCCGGEVVAEARNDASERADHEHHAHAAPSKAAPSSCCSGATKDGRADDPKSRNVVSN